MKWLEIFYQKTRYPEQQLTDKQNELIDMIDSKLASAHLGQPVRGSMTIKMAGVPFMSTLLPVDNIIKRIGLQQGDSYVPRSVALVVDSQGNWLFIYSVRTSQGSDEISCNLFIDALNRTNNARRLK